MTAKEYAKKLFNDYAKILPDAVEINRDIIRDCALIAVNELKKQEAAWTDVIGYNGKDGYFIEVENQLKNQ